MLLSCVDSSESKKYALDSPEAQGFDLFIRMACNACHSVDGSLGRGPTLINHMEKEIRHTDGSVAVIDDDYIHESIVNPQKYIAEGFPPIMPSYESVLSKGDIKNIIEYIRSLK